jgi:hypothetical protein
MYLVAISGAVRREEPAPSVRRRLKTFELEFCTVARWQNGEIVEENLFYDQVGFVRQIGVL